MRELSDVATQLDLTTAAVGIAALVVFLLAYAVVIGEEYWHLRKSMPVLVAAGIIDAAKVTRAALQNAAAIAALFLTTEAVVADKPETGGAGAPAGMGGGMPGMGMPGMRPMGQ
mgnify:CR=1 FL=1